MPTTEQRMTPNTIPALLLDRARSKQSRAFVELWSSSEKDSVFSVSYAELADSMIAAAVWLRDGPSQCVCGRYLNNYAIKHSLRPNACRSSDRPTRYVVRRLVATGLAAVGAGIDAISPSSRARLAREHHTLAGRAAAVG